jgi:enoyl-CoA hydratase/carnithine racemase
MSYEQIKYEVNDPIAVISLNRPETLNSITDLMQEELKHALAAAEADERVVGIVLTGAGRGFSSGYDAGVLESAAADGGIPDREDLNILNAEPGNKDMGENFTITYSYLLSIRKPMIAAVNGACAGLGLVFAALCDLRFVERQAKLTTAFANRGLIAEHGSSWILPRLMGPSKALDILLSGRKFTGEEAERLGLADRLCEEGESRAEAETYIRMLADTASPQSMRAIKAQVYRHLNMDLGEAMRESNELMGASIASEDIKEGVMSYIERRAPNFKRVTG